MRVKIALTGTPLIGDGYNTKDVFGAYIHQYYYNRSIADRYTLKLIREGVATKYRKNLQTTLEEITTVKSAISKKELYAHPKYVKALVDYITQDFFYKSRIAMNDYTIGGMIVCDSSEQARAVYTAMQSSLLLSSALILHDEDDTVIRRQKRDAFKEGQLDFLIVYNMLLTGFDSPRLKKLYLGRVIKDHSLLQALTRVNRPYKKFRYGYVVDFAPDIRAEFDKPTRPILMNYRLNWVMSSNNMTIYSRHLKKFSMICSSFQKSCSFTTLKMLRFSPSRYLPWMIRLLLLSCVMHWNYIKNCII